MKIANRVKHLTILGVLTVVFVAGSCGKKEESGGGSGGKGSGSGTGTGTGTGKGSGTGGGTGTSGSTSKTTSGGTTGTTVKPCLWLTQDDSVEDVLESENGSPSYDSGAPGTTGAAGATGAVGTTGAAGSSGAAGATGAVSAIPTIGDCGGGDMAGGTTGAAGGTTGGGGDMAGGTTGTPSGGGSGGYPIGKGIEGCAAEGKIWIAVKLVDGVKQGVCGANLDEQICCSEYQNYFNAWEKPLGANAASLTTSINDAKSRGLFAYGCSTDGTKITLHAAKFGTDGAVDYKEIFVGSTTPDLATKPQPATCEEPTMAGIGYVPGAAGGGTTSGMGTGTTGTATGEKLGSVSAETTELTGFAGKSAYAVLTESTTNSLMFTVSGTELTDAMFKKVKKYECKACDGDDDPHCKLADATGKYLTIMFANIPTIADPLTDDGFPKKAEYVKADKNDVSPGMMISYSDGNKVGWGTMKFVTKPTAVEGAFEADLDLEVESGKKYKAKIKGKVKQYPTNPTPPTCDDDEYLDAEYE